MSVVPFIGRVVAIGPDHLLVDAYGRLHTLAGSIDGAAPGDLIEGHPSGIAMRMRDGRVLRRPRRDPFGAGAETATQLGGLRDRLRLRARVIATLREYLAAQGSLEVDTPIVVPSPGLDAHLHAFEVRDANHVGYLITSPEYHLKRLVAGGLDAVHQFAPCFRADESGRRHEPQFTMLEWYVGPGDFYALERQTEALVRAASQCASEPGILRWNGAACDANRYFECLTVREAFARYCPEVADPIALARDNENAYFAAITDRIEPHLGIDAPTFLTHHPASHASLARLDGGDRTVCLRLELYVLGLELCNGFDELTDPIEQRARFRADLALRRARGLPEYPVDERFLAALDEGLPPCAGNALGVDRLVALVAGAESIADVMAFPSARR